MGHFSKPRRTESCGRFNAHWPESGIGVADSRHAWNQPSRRADGSQPTNLLQSTYLARSRITQLSDWQFQMLRVLPFALTSEPSMPIASSDVAVAPLQRTPPNLLTLISIAAVASALAGFAREVIGQDIATRLAQADWFPTSTVFAPLSTPTRLAGACGTLANLVLGGMAALLVRVDKRLTSGWYFLWVFGCVSLMNSGRLLYSAISGTGDWSVVISTFNPPWLWRMLLAAAGIFIYRPALRFAVTALRDLLVRGEVAYQDLWRFVLAAYLTASVLFTASAALNPVNSGLVVIGVVGASFGLNFGLLLVPAFISQPVESEPTVTRSMPFNWLWLIFAFTAAAAFLAGLGRAIRL
jgi:hypothetical protein